MQPPPPPPDMASAGGAGGALTVSVSVPVPVPPALVALRAIMNVPAAVGVPEMTPVVALSAKPVGKPVAPKLVGLFKAVIV